MWSFVTVFFHFRIMFLYVYFLIDTKIQFGPKVFLREKQYESFPTRRRKFNFLKLKKKNKLPCISPRGWAENTAED